MEKRTPSYSLDRIKNNFSNVNDLRLTKTALKCIVSLGFSMSEVVIVINSLSSSNFYKSMTTYADHKIWQDVYYIKYMKNHLYVKFMFDDEGYLIISFKER